MKQYIEAGEIVTTHGVMGELKLYPWCDGPDFVAALPRLFFTPDGGAEKKIESVRAHKGMCILKLAGVDGMDATRPYLHKTAYFARDDVKLPAGRYFAQDIIGCTVQNADTAEVYGTVTDILHPASSDVYEVKNSAGEVFLFPAVPEFLSELAPEKGIVTVRPIPGMFTNAGGSDDAD
ncbi:MAG: ribosome maturation factor RimM [Ruthenibacterium sp.]